MKKSLLKSILSICFVVVSSFAYSQTGGGVAINKNNATADPSAMLDVSSTSAPYMGMLIPRMSTANRNSITSPATGLQIFNTDCGINEYYTGTCWISLGQNLRTPDPIACSGTTDFCANGTRSFNIPVITGATTYQWTVPAGATIVSGQGTTSATVLFGNHSGDVCVTSANICEVSASRCINVYINPVPPTPGNITGPTSVIPGTSASYFIAGVAGVNLYSWTVPSGATITSGAGTTSITVSFSCSAVSGNISVAAQNNCGASPANTLAVTLTPLVANAGPNITSPGTLGGSPTASGGASSYTYAWVPSTNLSSTTVANPTTTVCTNTTYTVNVTDGNGCTSSSSVTATVNPVPSTPGPISGNASPACNATGEMYSISPVTYATSYTWTVPSGSSIVSGQGTTSITINYGNAFGNITVTASNACGTSGASTLSASGTSCSPMTLNYTGSQQTFMVPSGVTSLTIEAWGAKGGNSSQTGRNGGYTKGTLSVTPGTIYYVYVGGQGGTPTAGYNGGGAGGVTPQSTGGGGGGASDIRTGTNLTDRIMVAAGGGGSAGTDSWGGFPGTGGGGGFCSSPNGYGGQGALGCSQGTDGGCSTGTASGYGSGGAGAGLNSGGTGGGDSSGGSVNGATGTLGNGGAGGSQSTTGNPNGGGGGGGGYYGGGGGASGSGGCNGAGGGGSSYVNNSMFSSISFTAGLQAGNGKVTFSW